MLAGDNPDIPELQEILADIVGEDLRAGEVITRLRALLQRGETTASASGTQWGHRRCVAPAPKRPGRTWRNHSDYVRRRACPTLRAIRCNFNKSCLTLSPMHVMQWRRICKRIEYLGFPTNLQSDSVRVSIEDQGRGSAGWRCQPDFPAILHHEKSWPGHRTVHLPVDHRGTSGTDLGGVQWDTRHHSSPATASHRTRCVIEQSHGLSPG